MADTSRPILLVDAYNVFTRHYIANPSMSSHGHHIGGTAGFLKSLQFLTDNFLPSEIVVVWEGGGSSRRRTIFKDYKKGSKPQKLNRFYGDDIPNTLENRNYQISLIIEAIRHVPVNQVYVSDCEADDVIAYLAKYRFSKNRCVIISSDKDYYQLLSKRVIQWSPGQKDFVTSRDVVEKFGMIPENFCVARCFCGDGSDAIPGIKGAGFKTLLKRFPELAGPDFISVDEILRLSQERAPSSKIKLYNNINENPDVARRNWKLMYLGTNGMSGSQVQKIEGIIDTFQPVRDKIGLMRIFVREGFLLFDANSFYMTVNSILGQGKV